MNSMLIKCELNWYLSTVKRYRINSLVSDIFLHCSQTWLFDNSEAGIVSKRLCMKDTYQKERHACYDVIVRPNDVTF